MKDWIERAVEEEGEDYCKAVHKQLEEAAEEYDQKRHKLMRDRQSLETDEENKINSKYHKKLREANVAAEESKIANSVLLGEVAGTPKEKEVSNRIEKAKRQKSLTDTFLGNVPKGYPVKKDSPYLNRDLRDLEERIKERESD